MSSSSSSSSSSPCAACKFLRRKCMTGCVFAPYFPPDNPARFAHVHRVFGASNVSKLLNDLTPEQREDAVNTLAYEAEARLRDPVYGCVGYISLLQHRLLQLQRDLSAAKMELANYAGPAALGPFGLYNQFYAAAVAHQQEMAEAQQLAEVVEMARFLGGGDGVGVTATAAATAVAEASPPLPVSTRIGVYEDSFAELRQQEEEELGEGSELHLHHNLHQRRSFDDGRNGAGPSS